MKQYTQEEFNNFTRDEFGYLQCPPGDYSLIKEFPAYCSFGEGCSFGGCCSFGERCDFGEYCSFGKCCRFGECCSFDNGGSFGEGCSFGEWCSFGEDCSFAEGCTCEKGYKFKSLFVAGYLGSRGGQTYFWLLEDGNILVRCGCFCGMIDDFAKRVEEEHGNNVHGRMYRLAIEMARVKAESLS